MIPKDAIDLLKDMQNNLEEKDFLGRCALDMAIEALKGMSHLHLICPHCFNDFYYNNILQSFELKEGDGE